MSLKFALIVSKKKELDQKSRFEVEIISAFKNIIFLISANQIKYFRYFFETMTFRFRSTSETSKSRRNIADNSKNSTKLHFFLFIDDFLFLVRDTKIISSNVRRMCRCLFSSFASNRRHCVDASIISKEFRLDKRSASRHCDVHRIFYALSNFDRVLLDLLTIVKRHKHDEISSIVDKLLDINLFSRFALSFDFQIHFEHDFE